MPTIDFNADEFFDESKSGTYELVPAGKYVCQVVEDCERTSKKGDRYLQLTIKIVDGEYKNRQFFDRIMLWHRDSETQNIARKSFASLCRAVNLKNPTDSSYIHNKPFLCRIGVKFSEYSQKDENEVKGYLPLPTTSSAPLQAPPKQETDQKSPW